MLALHDRHEAVLSNYVPAATFFANLATGQYRQLP